MKKKVDYPIKKDVDAYNAARTEIVRIFSEGIISPEQYKRLFNDFNLPKLLPKVIGWATKRCAYCLSVIKPEGCDLDALDVSKCKTTKPNDKCHVVQIRCRDVIKNDKRCRELDKNIHSQDDLENIRWHFLHDINDDRLDTRRVYCNDKCKKDAQNKKSYSRNWYARKMKRL